MEQQLILIELIAAVLAASTVLVTLARHRSRVARERHDDLRRVGTDDPTDPATAGLRAGGKVAWMRPGGGGF